MEKGLFIALLVSAAWMLGHILLMHGRPAENRAKAMTLCWLASLPVLVVLYWTLPASWLSFLSAPGESAWMGFILCALSSLLLYFLFVECFYHIERAVTLRILIEILRREEKGADLDSIRQDYDVADMIRRRLDVLRDRGFIENRGGAWHLLPKGRLFARTMQFSCWLWRCKGQKDRG